MALMVEGMRSGNVQNTGRVSKLVIEGISKNYPVYRIRLDELYYNPQNDRIATWMSGWRQEHGGEAPDVSNREEYNDIVGGFIEQSNPDAIKKTRKNIELYSQQVPGIVLDNGLIIDGNRRFTCLRQLAKTDEKFNWIDAMILDQAIASDRRRVKLLELAIQFGQEGKVDYNPIDRLVGVYSDILIERLLTVDEYAKGANMTERDVKGLVERARLMGEFLDFCNAPRQFQLARELEIAGALNEIPRILKKCADDEEREEVKQCIFANMLAEPKGDITRYVRRFKPVLESPEAPEFIKKELELACDVTDRLAEMPEVSTKTIREEVRGDDALIDQFNTVMDDADTKAKANKLLSAPAESIKSAARLLEQIDGSLFSRLPLEERQNALRGLEDVLNAVESVRKSIEACEGMDEA